MLFVGTFRCDRGKDPEFFSVLWQGSGPPADMKLLAAYNLMTDVRVFVFEAESAASIRWWDKLNTVGAFECHPALDQTSGYHAVMARDTDGLAAHMRTRAATDDAVSAGVELRTGSHAAPSVWAALEVARAFKERARAGGASTGGEAPAG